MSELYEDLYERSNSDLYQDLYDNLSLKNSSS